MSKPKTEKEVKKTTAVSKGESVLAKLDPKHAQALAKVEDVGTAMMRAGQQMVLAYEEILQRDFGFSEEKLSQLSQEFEFMMRKLAWLKRENLNVYSKEAMHHVSEITRHEFAKIRQDRGGILLPKGDEVKKLGGSN